MQTPHTPISRAELALLLALAVACLVACFGPTVAQHAHYHAFADQRIWWHIPFTMDVLSNLPFAVAGIWGLVALHRLQPAGPANTQRCLAALFFGGLVLTAICSSFYHWQPDNAGLAVDRLGMVVAFAGLLGLAAAERVSARAGWVMAGTVLLLGPLTVGIWANTGNLLPWAVLQGGGMLLMLAFAQCKPASGAWGIRLSVVIAVYTLAKVLELGDHQVFEWTQGLVSGHSLKHMVAAGAAWPVIAVMHNHASIRQQHAATVWA